jgi:hypothetical protein
MTKNKFNWQLPTHQSNLTNNDYIRYNAKLHCYEDNKSLCNKHSQDTRYFEDYNIDEFLNDHGEGYVCKSCLTRYRKLIENKSKSR